MSYAVEVLAHSISPRGVEIFTLEITYPRFIHSEFMTHRRFSRNAASSRAIPPEKMIDRIIADPFIPETFNARVKGMGVGRELHADDRRKAWVAWNDALYSAIAAARKLVLLKVDKSRINRLLEPFMWMTTVVTATEWENFFALRCPDANEPDIYFPAQLEFQRIAIMMRDAMNASEPYELEYGQWHLPYVSRDELHNRLDADYTTEDAVKVSARRCAAVSYLRHAQDESWEQSIEKTDRMLDARPPHLSPFEHVARPARPPTLDFFERTGNFEGWVQYRKTIPNEDNARMMMP